MIESILYLIAIWGVCAIPVHVEQQERNTALWLRCVSLAGGPITMVVGWVFLVVESAEGFFGSMGDQFASQRAGVMSMAWTRTTPLYSSRINNRQPREIGRMKRKN